MEQVFDIPQRELKPDMKHHCQADYLEARFEVLERIVLCEARRVGGGSAGSKPSSFDMTTHRASTGFNLTAPDELVKLEPKIYLKISG